MVMTKILISFDLPEIYVEKIRNVSPEVEVVKSEEKEEVWPLPRMWMVCLLVSFRKNCSKLPRN